MVNEPFLNIDSTYMTLYYEMDGVIPKHYVLEMKYTGRKNMGVKTGNEGKRNCEHEWIRVVIIFFIEKLPLHTKPVYWQYTVIFINKDFRESNKTNVHEKS